MHYSLILLICVRVALLLKFKERSKGESLCQVPTHKSKTVISVCGFTINFFSQLITCQEQYNPSITHTNQLGNIVK